jgi:hypothetical protein
VLISPKLLGAFDHRGRTGRPRYGFSLGPNQELASTWGWKMITVRHQVHIAADPVVGPQWSKSSEQPGKVSTAEVLRLRATSAVSRDKSVRRSAQDDDFVGVLT